jgi:hypothetical protein
MRTVVLVVETMSRSTKFNHRKNIHSGSLLSN